MNLHKPVNSLCVLVHSRLFIHARLLCEFFGLWLFFFSFCVPVFLCVTLTKELATFFFSCDSLFCQRAVRAAFVMTKNFNRKKNSAQ